jgi:hypothetical protein
MLEVNTSSANYTCVNIFLLFLDNQQELQPNYSYEDLYLKPQACIVGLPIINNRVIFNTYNNDR